MKRESIILLAIPLILSAFTHLWNPIGFPDLFSDEGHYMRRAMHVLQGLGPQESATYYDHPFFGQLFLAGVFWLIGYPDSLNPSSDVHSIEMLYLVPRLLMGLLAVVDTFLIYKISESRYNKKIAFLASTLFAVMPISWLTRNILLDCILLPFLLSSILLALYSNKVRANVIKDKNTINAKISLVVLSGILLGLAIFTKIPAFVTIPLIAFLIFKNTNRSWKILAMWFVPVILIPLIWPAYSLAHSQFDHWSDSVMNQSRREGIPLLKTIIQIVKIDPVLMILGIGGLILAVLKKDLFILLWFIPTLLFLFLVEWKWAPERVFIPLIPLFCIAGAVMIIYLVERIKYKNIQKLLSWGVISAIGVFGLVSTSMLITTNVTAVQFQTATFVSQYLDKHNNKIENTTIVSPTIYSWIFKYVFNEDHVLNEYFDFNRYSIKTDKTLFIADYHFKRESMSNKRFGTLYNNALIIAAYKPDKENFDNRKYPYTSMNLNADGLSEIDVGIVNNSRILAELCVKHDVSTITVTCKSTNLTDVYKVLGDSNLLTKQSPKTWILNANLEIKNGTNFYINSTETEWLKINSTTGVPHNIKAHGNLIIDSVKITSWNTTKNDYVRAHENDSISRGYMVVNQGTGTTNITNSEIAYLGYNFPSSFGLTYYTGKGSIIKNNKIHDLYYGFYSDNNIHNIAIESNEFYNNTVYGIDPHSGTYDLIIKNNKVYNNGKHGIFCSTDCYNILIDSNKVYNNKEEGIMLYRNVSNSVISNNTLSNNRDQIAIYDSSNNNKIYNNEISAGKVGIRVISNSSQNLIRNNSIMNSGYGIYLLQGASDNEVDSNRVVNTSNFAVLVQDPGTNNNVIKNNILLDNQRNEISRSNLGTSHLSLINNTIGNTNR